ncbi:unnamed protein product [Tetraodon nigroviridis]|uniref:Chromosome 1 SCAF15015, whole genome shotgun sequence n=1 Tax=Tetraodon nigroviridis TaxID=99883 RepID=Q4RNB8_TETNG|nr:unnamed protein product [Tetraodon nigroviridis]
MDLLECPICLFLMSEPVTVSCGHTFCRRCVGGSLPPRCPSCKDRFKQREVKNIRNNVLLIGIVEKCCPDETKVKCLVQERAQSQRIQGSFTHRHRGPGLSSDRPGLPLRPSSQLDRGETRVPSWQNRSCHISFASILPIQST